MAHSASLARRAGEERGFLVSTYEFNSLLIRVRLSAVALTCALIIVVTPSEAQNASPWQPTLLGTLPGDTDSSGQYLSADGATAILQSSSASGTNQPVLWTATGAFQSLTLPGYTSSTAQLSSDGSIAAGTSCDALGNCQAFVWTKSGGLQGLGFLPGDTFSEADVVGPGVVTALSRPSTAGGRSWSFIWTPAGGIRAVGPLPGKTYSRVLQVSADGSTLVGQSCNVDQFNNAIACGAFAFDVATNTIMGLGILPNYTQSFAEGISADNTVVSVLSCDPTGYTQCQAGIWMASNGLQGLGFLPGDTFSLLNTGSGTVSSHGPTTVGFSSLGVNSPRHPFVWTATAGSQALLNQNNNTNTSTPFFLSSNGAFLVGEGFQQVAIFTPPNWNYQLIAFPGDTYSQATVTTDAVVIGQSGVSSPIFHSQPYRWTPAGGLQALGVIPGFSTAIAVSASPDGSAVVGWDSVPDGSIQEAYVWSTSFGLEPLGYGTGYSFSDAEGISAGGTIALGESCTLLHCQATLWTRSTPNQVPTPTGGGVSVAPVVTLPGGTTTNTVQVVYSSVGTAGTTTVTAATTPSGGAPPTPSAFQLGATPLYYDVSTTASFTGPVQLCFTWQEGQFVDDNNVQLFHYQNGAWQNVTTSLNATSQTVCGQVTSLSPFGLFEKSYAFSGFFPPVDNPPSQNIVKAGSAIPVIFSLNGNQGLGVFYSSYPVSQPIACATGTPTDTVTETVTANTSGLQYDASSNEYTYVWKTDKTWANSCRQLIVKFNDGSQHTADFAFH